MQHIKFSESRQMEREDLYSFSNHLQNIKYPTNKLNEGHVVSIKGAIKLIY